jgi:hypothetical protein
MMISADAAKPCIGVKDLSPVPSSWKADPVPVPGLLAEAAGNHHILAVAVDIHLPRTRCPGSERGPIGKQGSAHRGFGGDVLLRHHDVILKSAKIASSKAGWPLTAITGILGRTLLPYDHLDTVLVP